MSIYIANFGRGNRLWERCRTDPSVMTFEDEDLRPFWLNDDRAGYISYAISHKKTAKGITPTRPVASRWFNVATIFQATADDIWIHKDKNVLWWTRSINAPAVETVENDHEISGHRDPIIVIGKSTRQWSDKDQKGRRLVWDAIHPKARDFLITESTLQELAADKAEYAAALLAGENLESWHDKPAWKQRLADTSRRMAYVLNAEERSTYDMAYSAFHTAANSNGQEVTRTVKNKEIGFSTLSELQSYLNDLLASQEKLCALTGLPLQFNEPGADWEMKASLDRIDSSGHYVAGNLQIVCWFINRWKSDGDNREFQRLLGLLGAGSPLFGSSIGF